MKQHQVSALSVALCSLERLSVLRAQENCIELSAVRASGVLARSHVSTLALDGNLFDMKQLSQQEGYEEYEKRYSAAKKKLL